MAWEVGVQKCEHEAMARLLELALPAGRQLQGNSGAERRLREQERGSGSRV